MTRTTIVSRLAFSVTFAFSLAACGGSQPPMGAPGAMPQSSAITQRAKRAGSWMLPEVKSEDLLYVTDGFENVYVYTYPEGKLSGELTGFISPRGECVDPAGDVFIVSAASRSYQSSIVYEYAHGGTEPIATLADPVAGGSCAIDPATGNLAVAGGASTHGKYDAGVAIFAGAKGYPTIYSSSEFIAFDSCGYDDRGNLYVDAPNPFGNDKVLVRLSNGSSSFEEISLDTKFYGNRTTPPAVQWDGRYMTVTSDPSRLGPLLVYRLRISGTSGKIIGTTQLNSKKNNFIGQTWIQGKTFLAINEYKHGSRTETSVWKYPKGSEPQHNIRLTIGLKWGVTVSPAVTAIRR